MHRLARIKLIEAFLLPYSDWVAIYAKSRIPVPEHSRKEFSSMRRAIYVTKLRVSRREHKKDSSDCNSFDIQAFI